MLAVEGIKIRKKIEFQKGEKRFIISNNEHIKLLEQSVNPGKKRCKKTDCDVHTHHLVI